MSPTSLKSRSKYLPKGNKAVLIEDDKSSLPMFNMPYPNRKDRRAKSYSRRPDETRWTQPSLAKRLRDRKKRSNSR